MRDITRSEIDKVWDEIGGMESEEEVLALSRKFTAAQPQLAAYLVDAFDQFSEQAVESRFFVGLVLWRCYEDALGAPLPQVTMDQIHAGSENLQSAIEKCEAEGEGEAVHAALEQEEFSRQPHLQAYIAEALFEEDEDAQLVPDEQAAVFMDMIIVLHAMDRVASAVTVGKA